MSSNKDRNKAARRHSHPCRFGNRCVARVLTLLEKIWAQRFPQVALPIFCFLFISQEGEKKSETSQAITKGHDVSLGDYISIKNFLTQHPDFEKKNYFDGVITELSDSQERKIILKEILDRYKGKNNQRLLLIEAGSVNAGLSYLSICLFVSQNSLNIFVCGPIKKTRITDKVHHYSWSFSEISAINFSKEKIQKIYDLAYRLEAFDWEIGDVPLHSYILEGKLELLNKVAAFDGVDADGG